MSKIKNILATLAVAATATFSLTFVVSAATADTPSVQSIDWTQTGVGYWVATEQVDDISYYSNAFTKGKASTLKVNNGEGSFTGLSGYTGHYKSLSVTLINTKGTQKTEYKYGTATTLTAKPNVSAPYSNATFFCSILDGTTDGTDFKEGYLFKLEATKT